MPESTEPQYWQSFKAGNADSFEYLYKTYAAGLYNYGSKFSKDKDLIKECIQDLFVGIWTRRATLGNPDHLKNYLYKSFRHLVFRKTLQLQNFEVYEEETDTYSFHVSLNMEEAIIDGEQRDKVTEQLNMVMAKLTPRQKEAIFLRFYEQLSYEEIAEVMDISVKASYKIMARALGFLKENLSKDDLMLLSLLLHLRLLN
ncbi:RNA polymerase sigma factor [Pedobacter gandavensis]|uniref:Sigma-70 family RNA polymerase sigma factor n=1 Tax=Pedobacter gandavensis TaxID=2679963 RepID=A0ABR6ERK5_9SPHI|nr:sigma-70 family RNA polymerase sigma factor [Pedobacter gandavensis]MBB2147893.1 sigma-70 family RNA polymerase sigma factor [Pedobacter gandavensis]